MHLAHQKQGSSLNIADSSGADFVILYNFNPCLNVFETVRTSESLHGRKHFDVELDPLVCFLCLRCPASNPAIFEGLLLVPLVLPNALREHPSKNGFHGQIQYGPDEKTCCGLYQTAQNFQTWIHRDWLNPAML
jgi:hypothetical protein